MELSEKDRRRVETLLRVDGPFRWVNSAMVTVLAVLCACTFVTFLLQYRHLRDLRFQSHMSSASSWQLVMGDKPITGGEAPILRAQARSALLGNVTVFLFLLALIARGYQRNLQLLAAFWNSHAP